APSMTDAAKAIERAAASAPHFVAPLRMLRDGAIGGILFALPDRSRFWPLPAKLPAPPLAIVCDDWDASRGPKAFNQRSLRRLLADAGKVVVVAFAAHPEPYEAAALAVPLLGAPAVLIECLPETQCAWLAVARKYGPPCPLLVTVRDTPLPDHGKFFGDLPPLPQPALH
ncbi:MAG: hypothetical protein IPM60_13220, partial [Rhodospirillales bacterium]|nr:hypothetical protein [Rhodospirillales bacterium]